MFPSLSKAISKKVTSAKDAVGAGSSQQPQPKQQQQQTSSVQHQPVAGAQQQAWLDTETRQDSTKLCEEALAAIVQAYNQPMISHYKAQQRTRKALPEAIRLSVTLGSLKHEDAAGPLRDATLANAAVGNAIRAKDTFTGIATRVSEAKARLRAVAGELQAVRRAEEDDRELAKAVRRVADTAVPPSASAADIDDAPCESVDASPAKAESSSASAPDGDQAEVASDSAEQADQPAPETEAQPGPDASDDVGAAVEEQPAAAAVEEEEEEGEAAATEEEAAVASPDAAPVADDGADDTAAAAAAAPASENEASVPDAAVEDSSPAKSGGKSKKKKKR